WQAVGQIVISAGDWLLTASVLYLLLPPADISLPQFLQIYLLAQIAVLLSHVPGGLGVFEAVILLLLPQLPPPALFSALLVYRGIYFLLPFVLAVLLFGMQELRRRQTPRSL
ncbi:MAG: flippase-like domain-containing protein, partial [Desulfuromonadales bacterium]|nr:flippase-like domain-containing protein [Desulfuromonadales bacterium]